MRQTLFRLTGLYAETETKIIKLPEEAVTGNIPKRKAMLVIKHRKKIEKKGRCPV